MSKTKETDSEIVAASALSDLADQQRQQFDRNKANERYYQRRDALNAAVSAWRHAQNPDAEDITDTAEEFLEWLTRLERIN